jgi:hypothetical protein
MAAIPSVAERRAEYQRMLDEITRKIETTTDIEWLRQQTISYRMAAASSALTVSDLRGRLEAQQSIVCEVQTGCYSQVLQEWLFTARFYTTDKPEQYVQLLAEDRPQLIRVIGHWMDVDTQSDEGELFIRTYAPNGNELLHSPFHTYWVEKGLVTYQADGQTFVWRNHRWEDG